MSSKPQRDSQSGQYGAMREKITKVASVAIREAAKSSKGGKFVAGKSRTETSRKPKK